MATIPTGERIRLPGGTLRTGESPYDWPGVHSARSLVTGEELEGVWFNRTKEWAARQRGEEYGYYDYATQYRVGFAPLPAFRALSQNEYQAKVADLVREIEEEGVEVADLVREIEEEVSRLVPATRWRAGARS